MALAFPDIDPIAIQIGPLAIRWYALAYLGGFLLGWKYALHFCRLDQNRFRPTTDDIDDFMTWAILGIILGGRVGYILFYNYPHYIEHPLDMLKVWEGGMAWHGGLLGVITVVLVYARMKKIQILRLGDVFACSAPIGFGLGRLANFVNGELYGRATDAPWGMVFPHGGDFARHPSQLYQAFLEGFVLFTVLVILAHIEKIRHRPGLLAAAFLFMYGLFRFIVEFFREPDGQLGFYFGMVSMGQILCLPMFIGAAIIATIAMKQKPYVPENSGDGKPA